ncbi:MAG: BLUF domain-containing protein [Polaromonas sp.]|uniref:BLUF domain-containing protein n=1 Tax=Polaromonas sp. TaxID=1869339 RepID=UPI0017A49167|nr:BLUF domain-containing protein [Polaromonas sp.]NMM11652.1 BLUF domain-containing protein [Polaromonas sp.]
MQKPPHLYEVLYVSTLAPDADIRVVGDIARQSRPANSALKITGLLIFDGSRFCQQIEGAQKEVLALLDRIRQDSRHINVNVVHHGPLAERRFQRFSMGYTTLDDEDVLERLNKLQGQTAIVTFQSLISSLTMDF